MLGLWNELGENFIVTTHLVKDSEKFVYVLCGQQVLTADDTNCFSLRAQTAQ